MEHRGDLSDRGDVDDPPSTVVVDLGTEVDGAVDWAKVRHLEAILELLHVLGEKGFARGEDQPMFTWTPLMRRSSPRRV